MSGTAPSRIRYLVFDIHGVLLGRTEPDGHQPAAAVLAQLRRRGYQIRFVTNSSSVSRATVVSALADADIAASISEVFTAGITMGTYLSTGRTGRRLFVIGSAVLRSEITRIAGDAIEWSGPAEAEVVAVSRDLQLEESTLSQLRENRTAHLVATCRDATFPSDGQLRQGPGPTVARVEGALGTAATVLGKPNHYVLTDVMGLSPYDLTETLIIGDSVEQDVMLANNAGARWLLLTGTRPATAIPSGGRIIHALDEMLEVL